jgi:hypothetical protein
MTGNHTGGVKLVTVIAQSLGWAAVIWLILDYFKSDTQQIQLTDLNTKEECSLKPDTIIWGNKIISHQRYFRKCTSNK